MKRELTLKKPINKMTRLEVMRFIDSIAPELHYFPKTTYGGRGLAEDLYQKYIAGEVMPISRYNVETFK
jgi:hypothetical protein